MGEDITNETIQNMVKQVQTDIDPSYTTSLYLLTPADYRKNPVADYVHQSIPNLTVMLTLTSLDTSLSSPPLAKFSDSLQHDSGGHGV